MFQSIILESSGEHAAKTPWNVASDIGLFDLLAFQSGDTQSLSEQEQRSDILDRVVEAPRRRTIQPRRRLGPINQTKDATSGTCRSEATTSTSREERHQDRSYVMWSSSIPSPWQVYKQSLMKMNFRTVRFAADAMRMLNGARL